MGPPTLVQSFRQLVGRALRETGQALDRSGCRLAAMTEVKQSDEWAIMSGGPPPPEPVPFTNHAWSRHRQLSPFLHCGRPVIHPEVAYVAPCATLIGSVRVQAGSSIWYGAVLRADNCANAESFDRTDEEILQLQQKQKEEGQGTTTPVEFDVAEENGILGGGAIYIGENTNVQDGAIVTARTNHCRIGNGVTIGHLAQIHSATVQDYCLIGMGAIIREGAIIETEAFVAAGSVVPPGMVIPSGELWAGNPIRKLRTLSTEARQQLHDQSSDYVQVALTQQPAMQLGGNVSQGALVIFVTREETTATEMMTREGSSPST